MRLRIIIPGCLKSRPSRPSGGRPVCSKRVVQTLYIWYILIIDIQEAAGPRVTEAAIHPGGAAGRPNIPFERGNTAIMLKTLRWSILILLTVFIGGAVYFHHQNTLSKISPQLDRLVGDLDRQVTEGWRATSRLRTAIREMAPTLFPVEKLRRYIPGLGTPKTPSSRDDDGHPEPASQGPRRQIDTVPETIYTWVDTRGVRHFSATKPDDTAAKVEAVRR